MNNNLKLTVHKPEALKGIELPLFSNKIKAGFPSPADDHIEQKLDLNHFLIKHPAATFVVRVDGNLMENGGIHHGDILIIDRAITPKTDILSLPFLMGNSPLNV